MKKLGHYWLPIIGGALSSVGVVMMAISPALSIWAVCLVIVGAVAQLVSVAVFSIYLESKRRTKQKLKQEERKKEYFKKIGLSE